MNDSPRVRVVFFDLGGTLLRVEPSVGEVYARAAARHGCDPSPASIEENFRGAWRRSLGRASARGYRCSDAILKREWFEIVRESFGSLVPPPLLPQVFEELYAHFASGKAWVLAPGVRGMLQHLRRRGVLLGVLSNWDSRFRSMLRDLRIEENFDMLVVSHEVGFEKPHPEIFREALRRSGTPPGQTLHVGDSLQADILPARLLGLDTLWVAPRSQRKVELGAGNGVDSLSEVPMDFWDARIA